MLRSIGIGILFVVIGSLCWAEQAERPTLKETLEWMHSAFPGSRSSSGAELNETRALNYIDVQGDNPPSCTISIVEHWHTKGKPIGRYTIIDLSLIDPNSIQSVVDVARGTSQLRMAATNNKEIIVGRLGNDKDATPYHTRELLLNFDQQYAARFTKAFKNAVTLCGGKTSTF